jgi:hypothetical protein
LTPYLCKNNELPKKNNSLRVQYHEIIIMKNTIFLNSIRQEKEKFVKEDNIQVSLFSFFLVISRNKKMKAAAVVMRLSNSDCHRRHTFF